MAACAEGGGAKARAALRSPRALELEAFIARHKQHIVRMEQVTRVRGLLRHAFPAAQ